MRSKEPIFTLPAQLETSLRESRERGTPLAHTWLDLPAGGPVPDLALVPNDAAFLHLRGLPANLYELPRLRAIVAARLYGPGESLLRRLAALPSVRAVSVKKFLLPSLESLAACTSLEHLIVHWAPKLVDLSALAALRSLRTLRLVSLKRVDLASLPTLPHLVELAIEPGLWNTLTVPSLDPLRRLPRLRRLSVYGVRPADRSLAPIAALRDLESLQPPRSLPLEEYARLSAHLPRVPTLRPVSKQPRSYQLCKMCGRPKHVLTGEKNATACLECDARRVARHVARWELARATAASTPADASASDRDPGA